MAGWTDAIPKYQQRRVSIRLSLDDWAHFDRDMRHPGASLDTDLSTVVRLYLREGVALDLARSRRAERTTREASHV